MTQNEIKRIYSQIENLSAHEIKELVDEEIDKSANIHSFTMRSSSIFGGAILGAACRVNTSRDRDIKEICKDSIFAHRSSIKEIIRNNPKSTNYIIEIVMLLAPAIAQQYTGFSGMAIVGTITYLCKQGIQTYIA